MHNQPFGKIKKLHFIGIGGIGMSALAKLILEMGYLVSGSDLKGSELLTALQKKGVELYTGHDRRNLAPDVEVVVTSSAISPANVEILEARDRKLPLIKRGELLAEIMRLYVGITIAGTHGKTTTTALVSAVFQAAGLFPTAVIGGKWFGINSNAALGKPNAVKKKQSFAAPHNHYFICESDESDGSFLKLAPLFSAVTNIDQDHLEHYGSEENLISHFLEFINKTPFYGKCFLCFENQALQDLREKIEKPFATYGFHPTHDLYAQKVRYLKNRCEYELMASTKRGERKRNLGVFVLNMLGEHNVLNSLAAVGLALEVGISVAVIKKAFREFKGIDRRMSQLGRWRGYEVMDDYGHHPTEIKATLSALRRSLLEKKRSNKKQRGRLVCIFQPHRYTRTLQHYKGFAAALLLADEVYVTGIYSAGEELIKGVEAGLIVNEAKKITPKKKVHFLPDRKTALATLNQKIKPTAGRETYRGILLTIGAGDIYQLAKTLVKEGVD